MLKKYNMYYYRTERIELPPMYCDSQEKAIKLVESLMIAENSEKYSVEFGDVEEIP